MDIDRIRECIEVSETLNFTKASRNLFIAQSVLSKHISSVERELGFTVFERTKRSVALTPLGQLFIDGSKPVIEAYDSMIHQLYDARDEVPDSLRIGYLRGAVGSSIPTIQSRFALFFPDIETDYITYEFNEIDEALATDRIDIAVAKIPRDDPRGPYEYRALFDDRYFLACDIRHPLSEKTSLSPSDLRGLTVALPAASFYTDDSEAIAEYLQTESNAITIKHNIRDINSLPILTQSHDWIGITFGHLARLYSRELALIPLDDFDVIVSFGVIWKRQRANRAIRKWADVAQEIVANGSPPS